MNTMLVTLAVFFGVFGGFIFVYTRMQANAAETVTVSGPASQLGDEPDEKTLLLAKRLKQAGILLSPEEYKKRVLLFTVVAGVIGLVMGGFGFGSVVFGSLLAFGAWKGGDFYIQRRFNKRMADFVDQFCDALGVMSNGVRSGQTIFQTLEGLVADFGDPLREEVDEVLSELRMGVPLEDALNQWVLRTPNEDLEIAATALIVQRQTGGNVAEILETVANTIRERNKLFKQINSLTAQGRMSGWVMSLLPVGLFFVLYLITPDRVGLLISHPIGLVLTFFGILMIGIGAYFIRKIVTIDV